MSERRKYHLSELHVDPSKLPPAINSLDHWPTPHEIYRDLFKVSPPPIEVFDFGTIPDSILKKEALRAAPLLAKGLLNIPFERVLFRYMFIPEKAELDTEGIIPDVMLDESGDPIPQPYCTLILRQPNAHWLAFDMSAMSDHLKHRLKIPKSTYTWELNVSGIINAVIDEQGQCRWAASRQYYAQTHTLPPELQDEAADRLLGGLADTIASFSLLLNAKNIPRRIVEPAPKVNAKRARNGKPLLPRITYIDGARYTTAASNTSQGGTHASPVPHLRRGHIRHLEDRVVWVRDCVVNACSYAEIDKRSLYTVDSESLAKGTLP